MYITQNFMDILIGKITVPSSYDISIEGSVFQVTSFKSVNLPFQIGKSLLLRKDQENNTDIEIFETK